MFSDTFYRSDIGYTSVCTQAEGCPPSTIAYVAQDRLTNDAELILPEGYNDEVLGTIRWMTGYYDKPVKISGRQASELRQIGQQLLTLDDENKIEPPLDHTERRSIQHLLRVVPEE